MLRTAEQYLKEELNIEMPHGEIEGKWFADNNLPMVVSCQYCHTTMALPSAIIDDEGNIFCLNCGK